MDTVEKFASTSPSALFTDGALVYAHQRRAAGLGKAGEREEALLHCRKAEEYAARAEKLSLGAGEHRIPARRHRIYESGSLRAEKQWRRRSHRGGRCCRMKSGNGRKG